jgi:hypothetical protein
MALKNPSVNCFRKFKRLQLTFQVVYITCCFCRDENLRHHSCFMTWSRERHGMSQG